LKETDLTTKIVKYLNTLPDCFAFRVEQRMGVSRGVSDILCCRAGKFIAIEVKMPGNKTTPLQDRFLGKIKDSGGTAIVTYSLKQLEEEWF
jgi:hypothetical protein